MTTSFLSRLIETALRGLALVVAAALCCSFFGRAVPFFDSLSHFRAHLAVLLFVLALFLIAMRSIVTATLAAIVAAYAAVSVSPFVVPRPGEAAATGPATDRASLSRRPLTLLQMNLRYDADPVPAIATIARLDPDVVTLQEMNRRWVEAMQPLRATYPYGAYCGVGEVVGGVAILSRIPFGAGDAICRAEDGFVSRRLDLGGKAALTVVSEHLVWPWPYRQGRQVAALGDVLAGLGEPLLIAGDFNAVPWSATIGRYAAASKTTAAGGIGPTWLARRLPEALRPLIGLPIDNILFSKGVRILSVARGEATDSDHLPVLVSFDLPAAAALDVAPARVVDGAASR
ncbi:endonuclease/exonuclease/phosphatase family protein [Jiella sonneratiae]|uniref:Endonuclease/exonuclease/phosphatase family protein n=1 Tax=Jiella sonneratiae TaxID=2816856 RepID=A0ABS3J6U0_9HYPH|nr:endonuclease/exonuclease/phosphatase family protein [Jiella sonneratiae]MBO0904688.1 endonuclease/exonuclease/phosphatase family protein [Jiella sonneratiae]